MEEEEEEEDKTSGLEALGEEVTESTALLGSTTISRERRSSRFRRRRGSFSGQGTASFNQAILMVRNINEVQESESNFF